MAKRRRDRSRMQKDLRRQKGERVFVFEKDLGRCLGEVNREEWEFAISYCGGDVFAAAKACGLRNVPPGVLALWGRTSEEAVGSYRRWQKKRRK